MNQQHERLGKITFVNTSMAEENGAGGNLLDPNNPVLQPPKDPTQRKEDVEAQADSAGQ
jgi:hypothetical protein